MIFDYYILGGGGMAKEIYEVYIAKGMEKQVKGFIVQSEFSRDKEIYGISTFDESKLISIDKKTSKLICGIGNPNRKRWLDLLEAEGFLFDTVIHPGAIVGKHINVSEGVVILAGAVLTTNITLGKHTIVNVGSSISHDVIIGNHCTISPGVHIAGRVHIGNQVFIGISASCIPDIHMEDKAYIGAGSVVVRDIMANKMYYGVPAKAMRNISDNEWDALI